MSDQFLSAGLPCRQTGELQTALEELKDRARHADLFESAQRLSESPRAMADGFGRSRLRGDARTDQDA